MRVVIYLVIVLLAGCGEAPNESNTANDKSQTAKIYTVNYPLFWATQQLVADSAEVYFPAPADVDPAFWVPDLETLAAYQQADLIVLNGASYARWLSRVSLPNNRLLNTAADFSDQLIPMETEPLHSHGPQGDHSHGEQAFTVWLDLSLYAQQVSVLEQGLSRSVEVDAAALQARIQAWDAALIRLGQQMDGAPVFYSHPVYQYLDRAYGFDGLALHWEPGDYPSPQDWQQLVEMLPQHRGHLMLWEDEPLPETRARLATMGIEIAVFQPLGNRPAKGDFGSAMDANIETLRHYLEY